MSRYASIDELRADRRAYVEIARRNRFEDGLRALLADLYPDNAHFIYELLQNAEDAQATYIDFELRSHQLVVTHDGARAFNLDDVEAITGIGQSPKKDDETQIGKFGVGFKAVFAYTNRPEICSGPYAFAIKDLFVPESIEAPPPGDKTIFTFPFDRRQKPPAAAYEEVERGLRDLTETTLLFLRSIRSIRYELADGSGGSISRTDKGYPHVQITRRDGEQASESHWLRLVGDRSLSPRIPKGQTVAAAFRLDGSAGKASHVQVEAMDSAQTCIYFPAAKETSGLRFHIHAPFASTVARDSVRDTPENRELVGAIAKLVAKSLPQLRDSGWLTDGLLATLPNASDVITGPYVQMRDRVRETFREHKLTPVFGGGFATGKSLVDSPGRFRDVFSLNDLRLLTTLADRDYPSSPRWLDERRGRAKLFLDGLGVATFGLPELGSVLRRVANPSEGSAKASWVDWIARAPTRMLKPFYELLGSGLDGYGNNSIWGSTWLGDDEKRRVLRHVPLVRVGEHSAIVPGPQAYLPAHTRDKAPNRVPKKLAYFDKDEPSRSKNELRAFYEAVGVERWDERARVASALDTYRSGASPDDADHLNDLRDFMKYLNKHPKDLELFEDAPFLRCVTPAGVSYATPDSLFVDSPFAATGLAALYASGGKYALWPEYSELVDGIEGFAGRVGVQTSVRFIEFDRREDTWQEDISRNPQIRESWYRPRLVYANRWEHRGHAYRSSTRYSRYHDWDIPELEQVLATGNELLLEAVWNAVATAPGACAEAVFRFNSAQGDHRIESTIAQKLTSAKWVLDRNGVLRSAKTMTDDDLPDGWLRPGRDSLAARVGFGRRTELSRQADEAHEARQAARRKSAEELGVPIEFVDELSGLDPDERRVVLEKAIKDARRSKARHGDFPISASANPGRRAAVVKADAAIAPQWQTETRGRSVVVGAGETSQLARQYLREQYTNSEGDLFCQVCHEPMPFRYQGDWYFEAVLFVPNRARVHVQNALALCPLCAAIYHYVRDTDDDALCAELAELAIPPDAGRVALAIALNGEQAELWFTGKHAIDLQAALSVAGDER